MCSAMAQEIKNGATRIDATHGLQAWEAQSGRWLTAENFWQSYAESQGGLRWGRRSDYPPYNAVAERDLMIIELDEGACLMEFWHRRWRRAQDVRRWSEAFNSYGGCPHVFD